MNVTYSMLSVFLYKKKNKSLVSSHTINNYHNTFNRNNQKSLGTQIYKGSRYISVQKCLDAANLRHTDKDLLATKRW